MMGGWALNGYIYVLSASGNIERAQQNGDGTLGQWQITGSPPPAVGPPVLTTSTALWVIGNGGIVSETKFINGMPGNWMVAISPMVEPRSGDSAIYVAPYIYVVGGTRTSDGNPVNTAEFSSDSLTDALLFPDQY